MIYAIPIPQIIALDSGDLLAYCGTAFGIIGSFLTYRYEINKNKKERLKEIKPTFIVEVTELDPSLKLFNINIINQTKHRISYLYIYDTFVSSTVLDRYSFKITYNKSVDETEEIKPDYNINADLNILDEDGFPKYIQLNCDDIEGNS